MNLVFLKQTALDMLVKNIENNKAYYYSAEPWIDRYFQEKGSRNYCFDSGIVINDFELLPGDETSDVENSIRVYEAMGGKLNRLQATDFRLWSSLTHTFGWDYMQARWPMEKNKEIGRITDRYFRGSHPYMRNGISRLYWAAELTYDPDNENPYEYLEYVLRYQDLAVHALDRQIGRAKNSLLGNLQALKEADLNENDWRLFFAKINQFGGINMLDAISKEESLDVSRKYIEYILSLPIVENGAELVLKNTNNGATMQCTVNKGHLVKDDVEIKQNGRLLNLRKGALIEIDGVRWQIAEVN